ncbi:hypothetical protein CCO03_00925 [Comamonas serinivorans]|uniref:Uncharacterized protein n=1 Tax=Comamonas serinivorans TaxID=1082851 RepID=A0A1Y0EII8_9BURK|nr:hypothetical protein [Comamonas serinivorans]ARU03433.1 hypothetical protein CCO03_00925 [Comamonas serinivorans]
MAPVAGSAAPALMYPLSSEQADRLLATVMAGEFAGTPISRVDLPNPGYTATMRVLLDSHQITAVRVPARGMRDGAPVDGYYFEVQDAGTLLFSGKQRARKVFERLTHDAGVLAPALPQAR